MTSSSALPASLFDVAHDVTSAVARGLGDYVQLALSRRATPLDVAVDLHTWASLVRDRSAPRWATTSRIIHEWPIARLRDFSSADHGESVATLFLPPQAGHDSCIVDFDPKQSQVRTALDAGLKQVFVMDWVGATRHTSTTSIDDYILVLDEAVERLGGRVNLVGDCQGGWLAAIYAALRPEAVNTLAVAGAPIDFHAGRPLIGQYLRALTPGGDLAFYRLLVAANGGVLPGEVLLAGFITMQPEAEIGRQLQLLANLNDPVHLARYRAFEDWFKHCQPIAGAFYLWIVEHLFQGNKLVQRTLQVGEETVDLRRIQCPVYLLAGTEDHITPPPQLYALKDHIGTAPELITYREAKAGHLGLFMGRDALRNEWTDVFASVASHSGGVVG